MNARCKKKMNKKYKNKEKGLELKWMEAASTEQLKRQELEVKRLEITEQNKSEKQEAFCTHSLLTFVVYHCTLITLRGCTNNLMFLLNFRLVC